MCAPYLRVAGGIRISRCDKHFVTIMEDKTMVDFNSSISKVPAYQNNFANQGRTAKAGTPQETNEQFKAGARGKDAGAFYEKSSVLDSIVGEKVKNMTESQNLGKTVGQPHLSEKAQKYYEQLKAKFGDMDFIIVSSEEKANAMANSANYANPDKPVVLIGEDEVEKMANDESFRNKYEGIITMAKEGLAAMKDQFGDNDDVKGYGMQIGENGEISYFAVLKKANEQQADRIAKGREEKQEARKAEAKEEAKEQLEGRIDKARSARSAKAREAYKGQEDFGYEIVKADTLDELFSKVSDFFGPKAEETGVGGNVDFTA